MRADPSRYSISLETDQNVNYRGYLFEYSRVDKCFWIAGRPIVTGELRGDIESKIMKLNTEGEVVAEANAAHLLSPVYGGGSSRRLSLGWRQEEL